MDKRKRKNLAYIGNRNISVLLFDRISQLELFRPSDEHEGTHLYLNSNWDAVLCKAQDKQECLGKLRKGYVVWAS